MSGVMNEDCFASERPADRLRVGQPAGTRKSKDLSGPHEVM